MAKKMAKKRPPPPPPAPSTSSSEEGSSSSSSSSDDQEPILKPISKSPKPKTPTNNKEADGDSESGSSDEETVRKRPDPQTPTNSKAQETDDGSESVSTDDEEDGVEAEKPRSATKKPESVPKTAAPATPAHKPSDVGEKSDHKGKAVDKFQRIWSLDDEVTILKALIEYESRRGPFNGAGIKDFHLFVKDSLSLEVSDTQLYEKIRRLKRKYRTAAARARTARKAVRSGKPHDEKVYELSKKIWGAGSEIEVNVNSRRAAKRAAAAVANDDGGRGSLNRNYLYLKEALVKAGHAIYAEELAALDPERAMFFENEFKTLRVTDLRSTIREIDLVKQVLTFIVELIEGRRR